MQKYSSIFLVVVLVTVTHIALSSPIDLAASIVKEWNILHIANLGDFPWDPTAESRTIILNEDGTEDNSHGVRNVRDVGLRSDRPGTESWGFGGLGPRGTGVEGAWDRKRPFRFARNNPAAADNTFLL